MQNVFECPDGKKKNKCHAAEESGDLRASLVSPPQPRPFKLDGVHCEIAFITLQTRRREPCMVPVWFRLLSD